jgi:hypothetical protein
VVQCLHFGLIPLVTPQVGLELHDVWPALGGNTDRQLIDEISARAHDLAAMPDAQLADLAQFVREFAKANHTFDAYKVSLSRVLDELLPA